MRGVHTFITFPLWVCCGVSWASSDLLPISPAFRQAAIQIEIPATAVMGWELHRVKPGETLSSIGQRYGVGVEALHRANEMSSVRLRAGQELMIPLGEMSAPRLPPGVQVYQARPGDNPEGVAKRFGLTLLALVSANPALADLERLPVGQPLYIPTAQPGLLVRLQSGQTLLGIARAHGVPLLRLVQVNGVRDPLELRPGDWVLVPDRADSARYRRLAAALEVRRAQEAESRRLAAVRRQREARARQNRPAAPVLQRASLSARGFVSPLSAYTITTYFGGRGAFQRVHSGLDMAAPYGRPVYAAQGGQVKVAGWSNQGYGVHAKVVLDSGLETLYAHMSSVTVRAGQPVERGQVIGYVGSTGWSTGPHLHFEVRTASERTLNPLLYLR